MIMMWERQAEVEDGRYKVTRNKQHGFAGSRQVAVSSLQPCTLNLIPFIIREASEKEAKLVKLG